MPFVRDSCPSYGGRFLLSPTKKQCSHIPVCFNTCTKSHHGDRTTSKLFIRNNDGHIRINLPTFGRRQVVLSAFIPLSVDITKRLDTEKKSLKGSNSGGFDGLGQSSNDYALATVVALAQAGEGAVLYLGILGFEQPLAMVIGPAEAIAILAAVRERVSARPVTHEAWGSSLTAVGWKVDRVAVTDLDSETFYGRVVLSPTKRALQKRLRSVDVRPSDGIALALRCHAPLFVSKHVAEKVVDESRKTLPLPGAISKPPQMEATWVLSPYSL